MKNWYHADVSYGYPAVAVFNGIKYDTYILKHGSVEKIWYPNKEKFNYRGILRPDPETEEGWDKIFVDNSWVECPQNILIDFYTKLAKEMLRSNNEI